MRCLTDEQLERLAAGPDDARHAAWQAHARQCAACRKKLDQTQVDAELVGDIRELREQRDKVKPMADEMSGSEPRP